jgi:hypothetical protein
MCLIIEIQGVQQKLHKLRDKNSPIFLSIDSGEYPVINVIQNLSKTRSFIHSPKSVDKNLGEFYSELYVISIVKVKVKVSRYRPRFPKGFR